MEEDTVSMNGPLGVLFQITAYGNDAEARLFSALVELMQHHDVMRLDANAKSRCAQHLAAMYPFVEAP